MSILIVDDTVINSIVRRIEDSQEVSDPLTYLVKGLLEFIKDDAPDWESEYQYLAYKMHKINVRAYDERYNVPFKVVKFAYKSVPLCSDIQLLKYLDCWCYQIEDYYKNNRYYQLIDTLRVNLMKHIVRSTPEYLEASWSE